MRQYLLFDLDGTITDPYEGITNSVKYSLAYFGIVEAREAVLRDFIGPPLRESFKINYGFSDDEAEIAVEQYRVYYTPKGVFEYKLYEGVAETLKKLSEKRKLVLTTSKPEDYAVRILKHSDLDKYFTYICGSTRGAERHEKVDVIKYALGMGNISPEECVMIGDRKYDVLGAAQLGIPCIGVNFGYAAKSELEESGSACTVDRFEDLISAVEYF